MRVVIDTNILVSALIRPNGRTGAVLRHVHRGDCTVLYAQRLLEELVDVLTRPRIRDKYGVTGEDVKSFLALLLLRGEAVVPQDTITACRDPKDNKFLEVAVAGNADAIVSGDEDLLILTPFKGIPIITPAEFLRELEDIIRNEVQ